MASKPTAPKKMYAVVLADGTSEEFKTKSQAIARGEYSGQAFTVLSPRGYEVHVAEAPQPKPVTMPAEDVPEGTTVVGARAKDPVRVAARIRVGRKFVTFFDESGKDFLYVPLGTEVEIAPDGAK